MVFGSTNKSETKLIYVVDLQKKTALELSSVPNSFDYFTTDYNNNKVINGTDGVRGDIAIHQYDSTGSIGCLTLASGSSTLPVKELFNEIPDLFLHNVMKDAKRNDENNSQHNMNIERRPVRLILEERKATQKNTASGKIYWQGFV